MADGLRSVDELNFVPERSLFPSPLDWRDQFIYFLLVDRFDNNAPDLKPFQSVHEADAHDPTRRHLFQGGNLKGIIRRLDYIRGLGCTTIWLSPILKNRVDQPGSYHGYGIQDFLQVDPRFGTLEDLQQLTAAAHARDIYVILDVVLNHTGDVWAYPDDRPYYYYRDRSFPFGFWREVDPRSGLQEDDAVWPRELQRPDVFRRKGQIRNWHESVEAQNGDFLSLKELDLRQAEVLDTLIRVYKHWIAVADPDGFRIDTVKHMEDSATAVFCNAIREYATRVGKHNFFLFGEIVADDQTIQRYIGRNSPVEGTSERFPSLDAALDFPLYFMLEEVIKGFSSPALLRQRYEGFRNNYSDHGAAGRYFVTFVDNHDQMSRPYRRFMHGNPFTEQVVLAMAWLLTSQGVPCIYYGTEQGFDGGGPDDSYVRECMFGGDWGAFQTSGRHFFNPSNPIYQDISIIAGLRSSYPALRYGRLYFREISADGSNFGFPLDRRGTLAYSRILDTEEMLVLLNLDTAPRSDHITVDRNLSPPGSTMVNMLDTDQRITVGDSYGRAYVRVTVPAHGCAILKLQ
jgi:glycosidase